MSDDKIFVEAKYKNKSIIYNIYDFEHALVIKKSLKQSVPGLF